MIEYNGRTLDSTDYRDADVLEWLYWDQELSARGVADVFDVDHKTVLRWMDKHGVERRNNRTPGATYHTNNGGRCMWTVNEGGGTTSVSVQRLTAVAEYGFEAVKGMHTHHKIPIPWLNYPDNLDLKDPSTHLREHNIGEGNSNNNGLTRDMVAGIKHLLETTNMSHSEIAERYPTTRRTISDINTGDTWVHVSPEPHKT